MLPCEHFAILAN